MSFRLFGERVLGEEYKVEEKTDAGIIIPETAQQRGKNLFVAVKVGDDVTKLQEGDIFGVGDRVGQSVDKFRGYNIFTENQILGVEEDE